MSQIWVSKSQADLGGLFAGSLGWDFWGEMGCLVLVLENRGQHLNFVWVFLSLNFWLPLPYYKP
jgi:hypothetical protein